MGTRGSPSRDGLISALSAGFFLIIVGTLFIVTPGLFNDIVAFLRNFDVVQVPHFAAGFFLPAPKNPRMHVTVYTAAMQFSLVWGLFLIGILVVRIFAHSPMYRKAENASHVVFWLIASYLISIFLNNATTRILWFAFWAAIIILIGITLIVRAAVLAVFR